MHMRMLDQLKFQAHEYTYYIIYITCEQNNPIIAAISRMSISQTNDTCTVQYTDDTYVQAIHY